MGEATKEEKVSNFSELEQTITVDEDHDDDVIDAIANENTEDSSDSSDIDEEYAVLEDHLVDIYEVLGSIRNRLDRIPTREELIAMIDDNYTKLKASLPKKNRQPPGRPKRLPTKTKLPPKKTRAKRTPIKAAKVNAKKTPLKKTQKR